MHFPKFLEEWGPCLGQPRCPMNATCVLCLLVLIIQLFSRSLGGTSCAFHLAFCSSSSSDASDQGGRYSLTATHGSIRLVSLDLFNTSLVLDALLLAPISCYSQLPAQQEDCMQELRLNKTNLPGRLLIKGISHHSSPRGMPLARVAIRWRQHKVKKTQSEAAVDQGSREFMGTLKTREPVGIRPLCPRRCKSRQPQGPVQRTGSYADKNLS